jgi:hypothetical protein
VLTPSASTYWKQRFRFTAVAAMLLFTATLPTTPIASASQYKKAPRFTHAIGRVSSLYGLASVHLWNELLRPTSDADSTRTLGLVKTALFGTKLQARTTTRLNYRILERLPRAKPFGQIRRAPLTRQRIGNATAASSTQVQMISMGRFNSTDCWLYPFVYTLNYDGTTGALLSESAVLASPSVAASNGLPMDTKVC